jgi:hypothetical protein
MMFYTYLEIKNALRQQLIAAMSLMFRGGIFVNTVYTRSMCQIMLLEYARSIMPPLYFEISVVCDETFNPPDVIKRGDLIAIVYAKVLSQTTVFPLSIQDSDFNPYGNSFVRPLPTEEPKPEEPRKKRRITFDE